MWPCQYENPPLINPVVRSGWQCEILGDTVQTYLMSGVDRGKRIDGKEDR